ncbi:MAG: sulfatase-like hydrolase/transferase, partial [bacterium]|nr:sulfatase-like hydrolase/transferase [bacterium]
DVELEPETLVRGRNRLRFGFTYAGSTPADSRGPAVAFDYVAFGNATGNQPPEDQRQPEQQIEALHQPAGTEIVYTLLIPEDARLEFYSTVEGTKNPAAKVSSEVALRRPDGLEAVVHSREYSGQVGGHHTVNLEEHAGSIVGLVFRVTGDAGEPEAGIVWRRPRLVGAGGAGFEKNVVLIVIDTLRADVLATYGGPVPTPNSDALAARGMTFDNAYSHIPITGPSH